MGKREISSEQIDLGMRAQVLEDYPLVGSAFRAARALWAGSGSASHVWVRWRTVSEVMHYEGSGLEKTRPNGEAGLSPRNYNRAAVFGAGVTAVANVLAEHGDDGVPAMLYEHDGKTYAGPFNRPQGFGLVLPAGAAERGVVQDEALLAGAVRQGTEPLVGGMGILYPAEDRVVLPQGMHLMKELVPTRSMSRIYPGVPMV
jgi:hypothetical protein